MESAHAVKSDEKKATHAAGPTPEPAALRSDAGATAGMPIFLGRSPLMRQQEEEVQTPEVSEQPEEDALQPQIQLKCEDCETGEEEQGQTTTLVQRKLDSDQLDEPEVQFQLKIGQPGDAYERQADAMADRVVSNISPATAPQVQTQCADCESTDRIQPKLAFPPIPHLEPPSAAETASSDQGTVVLPEEPVAAEQKASGESDEPVSLPEVMPQPPEMEEPPLLQAKAIALGHQQGDRTTANQVSNRSGQSFLRNTLQSSQGNGIPIEPNVRSDMERHFGKDLGEVRVHTDGTSAQMNEMLRSRAFTHGRDIYFNEGEYQPDSSDGKHLLAHELTHTVQQGAIGNRVQRFIAPEQTVEVEPPSERPNDGDEVESRVTEKISNDPNVQNQDDLSEEERQQAQRPNRSEVRQESRAVSSSGESRPSVDRGALAEEQTETQQAQIEAQVQEQPPEADESQSESAAGESAERSEAEAAAQRAQAAEQQARAVQIPEQPEPFVHPRIEAPVDSAGQPLPRNSQIDTQVRGLGYIGEMLREKGYEKKLYAAQQEIGSRGLDVVVERQREDLANAETGTAAMESHSEARQEIAEQSHEAHEESVERQQFVSEAAPDLANQADAGEADSSELASESRSTADRSQSEIPDDPDARADAEEQSGEMQDAASGAESMDEAIRQTGERARQYQQEAEAAAEQNQQSETQITETEEIIAQTDARIEEMHAANADSQSQIESAASGPDLIRQHAQQTAQSGNELIAATIVMEDELNALQTEYLASMSAIESREAAIERQQREQEQTAQPGLSPEEQELVELAGMNDEEQEQAIAEMDQPQRDRLLRTLEAMITRAPDQGTDATEGARLRVDTGLSQAIMGEQPADPRAQQIQEVENRRTERVGGILDVADQNMNLLSVAQQQMLANRLVAESITDDIANINVLQMGKDMLLAMVDPRQSLVGIVGSFEKMLTGFANIGNWEAWQRDPLGNLLQIAADISTGLATIFSTILGIAGIIMALMVVLTIFSWGLLSPITGPVIAWMGTVMTYAGWGAIITGGLAVYFNYLSYIKNLHDAGTAETARELFGNTEQIKQNASDGFQGAMAVVEGVGAVKMGPSLRSGQFFENVPRSPGQWARQTVQGVREGAAAVASAPGRLARGIRELFGSGRQGLLRFKERIQNLFRRRRPGDTNIDTPEARTRHQSHLDEAQTKRVRDMNDAEFRAEMREVGENRPRQVDSRSEHFREYDVEIEANGHTYRRRRDGRGWCRFSAKECGIRHQDLSPEARRQVEILEDTAGFQEQARGREDLDRDFIENLDDVIDRPRGTPPTEAGVRGDIGEARHAAEIAGEGRLPPTAQQHVGRRQLRRLKDQLELERSISIKEFADNFPPEGARQMKLRTSRGDRVVDHMYVEGDRVVLRESKNVRELNLAGDSKSAQRLRTQIDKDLELTDLYDGSVVEWRVDGQINADTKAVLRLLVDENNGRFRVNPANLLD